MLRVKKNTKKKPSPSTSTSTKTTPAKTHDPMSDKELMDRIHNTAFLKDQTKTTYIQKIKRIQECVWTGVSLKEILEDPEGFVERLHKFAENTPGRSKNCALNIKGKETLGMHSVDAFMSAMMSIFLNNQDLRENRKDLFDKWKAQHEIIRRPIDTKYKSNEPTPRQKDAYISYEDVVKKRDSLEQGDMVRLLLMMYTEIPPVRSDYHSTRVYNDFSVPELKTTISRAHVMTMLDGTQEDVDLIDGESKGSIQALGNFVVLDKTKPVLVLNEYKTSKKYKSIVVSLPQKIVKDIEASMKKVPREYLFVSSRGRKPYHDGKNPEKAFNDWANYNLKKLFEKKEFHLTMLRHIYISRRDLEGGGIENWSGLEQDKVAKAMGHSVEQQRKYMWHTWLSSHKKKETDSKTDVEITQTKS